MIRYSETFDQGTLAKMRQHDPVVVFYRTFFNLIDWSPYAFCSSELSKRGWPAHPEIAYIKALLVKIVEDKKHITDLRSFLVRHPLLVLELGFIPLLNPADAAFGAWYVYETCAAHGGIAAIPLNQHAHLTFDRDTDGTPFCPKKFLIVPTKKFNQCIRLSCPVLSVSSPIS